MLRFVSIISAVFLLTLFCGETFKAQPQEHRILEYVRLIAEGRSGEVAPRVADLQRGASRNVGVLYLQGLLATDGTEAIRCFSIVADSFPKNEWADDALARLCEVFLRTRALSAAECQAARLRHEYPQSPYVATGYLTRLSSADSDFSVLGTVPVKSGTEYAIQIGAFGKRENALRILNRLKADGYQVDLYENFLDGTHLLHLVWVGSYSRVEDAQQAQQEIRTRYGIDGLLRVRSAWKKW